MNYGSLRNIFQLWWQFNRRDGRRPWELLLLFISRHAIGKLYVSQKLNTLSVSLLRTTPTQRGKNIVDYPWINKGESTMHYSTKGTLKQEYMFLLIEQLQARAHSQPAYCQLVNIKLSTFHYWLKKYNLAQLKVQPTDQKRSSAFLPLSVVFPKRLSNPSTDRCSIRFPNGVLVRLTGSTNQQMLLQIVHGQAGHDV
jgi:hypothetical protein